MIAHVCIGLNSNINFIPATASRINLKKMTINTKTNTKINTKEKKENKKENKKKEKNKKKVKKSERETNEQGRN